MNKRTVGKKLSMDGGKHIGRNTQYNVAHAIRIVGTRDIDGDGVIDMYDCQPLNPNADGFWGDVGHAARRRVAGELEDIKQRTVKRVEGEDTMEKRKTLRRIQREEEFVEEIKQARARGRQTARKKYRVATTIKTKKKKTKKKDEVIYHGTLYSPVTKKKTTTKRLRSKVAPKRKVLPYPSCI